MKQHAPLVIAKDSVFLSCVESAQPLQVQRVARETWDVCRVRRQHSTRLFVAMCMRGRATLESHPDRPVWSAGSVVVLQPEDQQDLFIERRTDLLVAVAVGQEAVHLCTHLFGARSLVVRPRYPARLRHTFEDLLAIAQGGGAYREERCEYLLRFVLCDLHADILATGTPNDGAWATWVRCKDRVDKDYCTLNSAQEWAGACGVDRAYLSRLCRRFTATTPAAYLRSCKLQLAAELLQTTSDHVQEIARHCGYHDPFTFSKAFRRQFGLSPRAWRKTEE